MKMNIKIKIYTDMGTTQTRKDMDNITDVDRDKQTQTL
jgi:hypothetical protein